MVNYNIPGSDSTVHQDICKASHAYVKTELGMTESEVLTVHLALFRNKTGI